MKKEGLSGFAAGQGQLFAGLQLFDAFLHGSKLVLQFLGIAFELFHFLCFGHESPNEAFVSVVTSVTAAPAVFFAFSATTSSMHSSFTLPHYQKESI
jgi:hypothetical protein